jgi:hypothetical protein
MNQNRKIQSLKSEGLSSELLSTLNETQISSLYNRLLESKKKEFEEQTQTGVTTKVTTEKITTVTPTALNSPQGVNINGINLKNQGGQLVAKELGENSEMSEKFESKAQQGLFWARCNKCKTDDCKWCKMAKEFSKSTSKKQYKKKETKEGYLDNVGKKVTDTYAKKFASFTPGLAWGGMKENYDNIIEKYTEPTMKKRDLLKLIESEIKRKKGLNEDFYMDEMDEEFDFDFMSDVETAPIIKPKIKPGETEPERQTPDPEWEPDFDEPMEPNPDVEPEPQAKRKMNNPFAPTIDPGIKEPKIKPKREKEPEWEPDFDEPMEPNPDVEPEPQAHKKRFMDRFKKEFNSSMKRMDESYYKPVKFKKF